MGYHTPGDSLNSVVPPQKKTTTNARPEFDKGSVGPTAQNPPPATPFISTARLVYRQIGCETRSRFLIASHERMLGWHVAALRRPVGSLSWAPPEGFEPTPPRDRALAALCPDHPGKWSSIYRLGRSRSLSHQRHTDADSRDRTRALLSVAISSVRWPSSPLLSEV